MSLKRILEGKSKIDKEFQEIVKSIMPKKEQFKTLSGEKAFSKYQIIASGDENNSYEASLVGTAFDYLARAMIANVLLDNKEHSTLEYKAFKGIKRIQNFISKQDYDVIYSRYIEALSDFIDFIYSDGSYIPDSDMLFECCDIHEWEAWCAFVNKASENDYVQIESIYELVEDAIFFAKLDHIYRSGGVLPQDGISSLLSQPPKHLIEDSSNLCTVFTDKFINMGLIQHDSIVVFNPSFSIASFACGGADADVYIDGTLYDFKSSKNTGYKWQEIAQLTAYFLLDIFACNIDDLEDPSDLKDLEVYNIAFYRARFGEVEYFTTESFRNKIFDKNLQEFGNHMIDRLSIIYPEE